MSDQGAFAAWLRERATAAGYDLSGPRSGGATLLAQDAGVTPSLVSRALSGQSEPAPGTLRRLAPVLGVTEVELFTAAYGLDGAPRPAVPERRVGVEAALDAWGIVDAGDRALVAALVERLRPARREEEA